MTGVNPGGNPEGQRTRQAIERRLQLAFPELAQLFPLLSLAPASGTTWRKVFDGYAEPASDRHLASLSDELEDLFVMGLNEAQLDVVSGVLGLDRDVALSETSSVYAFLAVLEERLSGERLARDSRPSRRRTA